MKYGYARVSTLDQALASQTDQLKQAGAEKIIEDKISGTTSSRPGLDELKSLLAPGDTVLVFRLDRLGRSVQDLISWMDYFQENEISFVSLHESIDTGTTTGKLVFHIFASIAEFERDLISDRVKSGLKAARARGNIGGRRRKLNGKDLWLLWKLHDQGKSIENLMEEFQISRRSVYNYLAMRQTNFTHFD